MAMTSKVCVVIGRPRILCEKWPERMVNKQNTSKTSSCSLTVLWHSINFAGYVVYVQKGTQVLVKVC